MWIILLVLSLTVGLSALGWGLFAHARGWDSIPHFATFLLGWLPVSSILVIVILCVAGARAGWRWTFVPGILILLAGVQWSLLVLTADSRATICFMPLVLICLSATALFRRTSAVLLPTPAWLEQASPLFAAIGLIAIAGAFGLRARERRQQERALESARMEYAKKDATAHGLDRAAWLLECEFSAQDGYSASEFIRSKVFLAPRSAGQYHWDDNLQRLRVTRVLFGELSSVRNRILLVAAEALRTKALRPGPRAELGGGVLRCSPPLDCTIVWEFDVESLHPQARPLRGATDAWVTALELSAQNELSP